MASSVSKTIKTLKRQIEAAKREDRKADLAKLNRRLDKLLLEQRIGRAGV